MNLDARRWFILFWGVLANLCQGAAYASSVFAVPVLMHFHRFVLGPDGHAIIGPNHLPVLDMPKWALAFSLELAMLPVGMLLSGKIADQKSPRLIVFIGSILFGGGILLAGFAQHLRYFYLGFGILAGLGSGCAYGTIVATSQRWFPDRRGLASGLAVGALGFGPVVIVPVANMLMAGGKPENTAMFALKVLGAAFFVIMAVASVFTVNPPKGYAPKGFVPRIPTQASTGTNDLNWAQMLSKGRFWLLYLLYVCGAFSGLMMISMAKPFAGEAMKGVILDPKALGAFAGYVVMTIALANAFGRLAWGAISDWTGRQWALVLMFLITAVTMFLIPSLSGVKSSLVLGAVLIGACFGGYLGIFPPICADSFGAKNMMVNYALLFSGFAVAAILGPMIGAHIQKHTGYNDAFTVGGCVAVLGLLVSLGMALSKPKPVVKA
jgi:OFA family oxalate/formate antiporter-like MFS transporter